MKRSFTTAMATALAIAATGMSPAFAQQAEAKRMSFFVTSNGSGKGADLGGLAGADKHCQSLAASAGAGNRTWRAYLSTSATGGAKRAVHARDRIGRGPWHNAKGELVARDIDDLHDGNRITKQTALTEKVQVVNGRGDKPNRHDILTGSDSQGRAFPGTSDTTCSNWTSSTAGAGSAQVGHHDRIGLNEQANMKSWNQSHPSRGCSQDNLRATGGDGLFYCFAAR